MKLAHPDFFFPIEISELEIPVLILENPGDFRKFIWELREQTEGREGRWVLSENNKPLNFAKSCEVIINPFALEINQRKLLTSLYDRVEKFASSSEVLMIWNQMESYFQKVTEELLTATDEFALIYRDSASIKDFLKFMEVRFEEHNEDVVEHMIDYLRMSADVMGTRLFVLCNLNLFFNRQEMQYLYEQALYHKFSLLLVEGHLPDGKEKGEKWMIVDKDNCVIVPDGV